MEDPTSIIIQLLLRQITKTQALLQRPSQLVIRMLNRIHNSVTNCPCVRDRWQILRMQNSSSSSLDRLTLTTTLAAPQLQINSKEAMPHLWPILQPNTLQRIKSLLLTSNSHTGRRSTMMRDSQYSMIRPQDLRRSRKLRLYKQQQVAREIHHLSWDQRSNHLRQKTLLQAINKGSSCTRRFEIWQSSLIYSTRCMMMPTRSRHLRRKFNRRLPICPLCSRTEELVRLGTLMQHLLLKQEWRWTKSMPYPLDLIQLSTRAQCEPHLNLPCPHRLLTKTATIFHCSLKRPIMLLPSAKQCWWNLHLSPSTLYLKLSRHPSDLPRVTLDAIITLLKPTPTATKVKSATPSKALLDSEISARIKSSRIVSTIEETTKLLAVDLRDCQVAQIWYAVVVTVACVIRQRRRHRLLTFTQLAKFRSRRT